MLHRVTLILIIIAVVLSACASQPADISAPDTSSTAVVQMQKPDPSPTSNMTAEEETLAGVGLSTTTFEIIPQESQVSYEVGETFIDQGNVFAIAIGVTKGISGSVTVDYENPQNSTISKFTIDISQFTSDSTRRDNAIRDRFLESSRFPLATFTPTSIEGLPAVGQEGVDYPLKINGELTVKETSKPVTFDMVVRLEGDILTGTASTTILLSDFGVGPISIAGILETQDEAKLTFTFVARSTH